MEEENIWQALFDELLKLLEPLIWITDDPDQVFVLLTQIGWDIEALDELTPTSFVEELTNVLSQAGALYETLVNYTQNPPEDLKTLKEAFDTVSQALEGVRKLSEQLPAASRPPQFETIATDLFDYLLADYLYSQYPWLYHLLTLLTIAEDFHATDVDIGTAVIESGKRLRTPHTRPRMRLSQIQSLLKDPEETFRREYYNADKLQTLAGVQYTSRKVFTRLARLLWAMGIDVFHHFERGLDLPFEDAAHDQPLMDSTIRFELTRYIDNANQVGLTTGVTLMLTPVDLGGLGLVVVPDGELTFSQQFGEWQLALTVNGNFQAFSVGPAGFWLDAASDISSVKIQARLSKGDANRLRAFLLGSIKGTHLRIGQFNITSDLNLSTAQREVGFIIEASAGKLVLTPGDGDSFLQKIMPGEPIEVNFDLALGWSRQRGIYFRGGSSLETTFSLHSVLGPFTLT